MKNLRIGFPKRVEVVLNYLKYVAMAWLIFIVVLLILPVISFQMFMEVSGRIATGAARVLDSYGLAVAGWAWFVAFLVVVAWPLIAFIVWIVIDSRKFKAQGIDTHSYLWGVGMIPPLAFVVLPLYLIKRNIIWVKKLDVGVIDGSLENIKIIEKAKAKRMWARVGIIILLIFFVIIPLVVSLLIHIGNMDRKLANFLVNFSLVTSCASGNSGCDEPRPLPNILQNKKIVFNENTSLQFDPQSGSEIGLTDLDILGSLDTSHASSFQENIVDPNLGERGYLSEKEYKIIRAVYHYNCSYCIDSGDYAYIVLEDSRGNRFSSLLDDLDFSTNPARDVPWDEQIPYDLGRDGELGKLVDINATLTQ